MSSLERSDFEQQSVFDRTEQLLRSKGSEILDMSRERHYIETNNAFYAILEGQTWEVKYVYPQFASNLSKGKRFAIHGPHLSNETIAEIESMKFPLIARGVIDKIAIATTEIQVSRNIDDFEATS